MKRVIGILLSIVLIVALLPVMPMRAEVEETSYVSIDPTTGEKSNAHQVCEPLASNATSWGSGDQTIWYAVDGSVTITDRITVSGDVHLILCDNATLTAEQGITVADDDNDPSNG